MKRFTIVLTTTFFLMGMASFFPLKKKPAEVLLFGYYTGEGGAGLYLLSSEDGYKWQPVKGGKAIVKPGIGDYVMRDPHISQSPDGIYHLVWATGENRRDIGYCWSKNLIEWSAQRLIPVMEKDTVVLNVWSPELNYDNDNQRFMLSWSSTVPGKFKETDKQLDSLPSGYHYNNRIYRKISTDLKEWGPTELFFNPSFNCADATFSSDGGRNMMFLKDATNLPKNVQNNIRMTTAASLTGSYNSKVSLISRRTQAEAPTAIRLDSTFIVYFNKFKAKKMGAAVTIDFKTWKDVSDSLSFPKGVKHGTVIRVQQKVLEKLNES